MVLLSRLHKRPGPCPAWPLTDLGMSCHKTAGLDLVRQCALGLVHAGFSNSEPLGSFCTRRRGSSHCPLLLSAPCSRKGFPTPSQSSHGQSISPARKAPFPFVNTFCRLPRPQRASQRASDLGFDATSLDKFCSSICFLSSVIFTAACSGRAYPISLDSIPLSIGLEELCQSYTYALLSVQVPSRFHPGRFWIVEAEIAAATCFDRKFIHRIF